MSPGGVCQEENVISGSPELSYAEVLSEAREPSSLSRGAWEVMAFAGLVLAAGSYAALRRLRAKYEFEFG